MNLATSIVLLVVIVLIAGGSGFAVNHLLKNQKGIQLFLFVIALLLGIILLYVQGQIL